jgi:biotin synthase
MNLSELTLDRKGLTAALACEDAAFEEALRQEAYRVKVATVGPEVYLRGLIEISNICVKDCLYCGIRRSVRCPRYELSEEEVLAAARVAASRRYGSLVIQGGERADKAFTQKITRLLKAIKALDTGEDPPLGITLSLGEQPREVYEEWFHAGAHRYLLRIEASNPDLYRKIHPEDHSYDRRLRALYDLKEIGYQAGTGAMIGLPYQTAEDMADDLLFYKEFDTPMVGMGPYNPHPETPLAVSGVPYPSAQRRFSLGLKMIALLRLLMPDINIAAATALEILDPRGREMGILSGANVLMPNITPREQMVKYNLYNRKILNASDVQDLIEQGIPIGYGRWGDSKHYK